MVQVKGSAITARVRFVREQYGERGLRELRAAVSPANRTLLEGKILPHEWVPYSLFIDVNVQADRLFGKGDLQLCYEMGRYGADLNLTTLYKIFYRLNTPQFIFNKASRVWEVHYDSGRLVPVDESGKSMRIRIEDFAEPHRAHCLSVLGWAVRSVELSGARVVSFAEDLCRTRGDEACEMSITWE